MNDFGQQKKTINKYAKVLRKEDDFTLVFIYLLSLQFFKMHQSKQHFLFVLLFTFIVESQVLSPVSNCLGNCVNCAPNDLSICKGALPCEWGYYMNSDNGTCDLTPAKQIIWAQLGERTAKSNPPMSESWGASTKQSICEYHSASGKKYIDVLGLFGGVTMLEKTFEVSNNSALFELSFNLIRDEWMPFNDFLLLDFSSKQESLASIEISYEQKIKVQSQPSVIVCGNNRVFSQKFNIKIENNKNIGNNITIVFTSFLYNSNWGLSNIKLISACSYFSLFDANTQSCSICDTDSYLVSLGSQSHCEKCSPLCSKCRSISNCTSCFLGAVLENGTCSFGNKYKSQELALMGNSSTCLKYSYYAGNSSQKITFSQLKNENSLLYDQIQLNFKLYYNPSDWSKTSTDKIIIKINKVQSYALSSSNLTNKGTISCSFKQKPMAIIEILTPSKVHNDNSIIVEFQLVSKNKQMRFGVSDVLVKSIKKQTNTVTPNTTNSSAPQNTTLNQKNLTNSSNDKPNNSSEKTQQNQSKTNPSINIPNDTITTNDSAPAPYKSNSLPTNITNSSLPVNKTEIADIQEVKNPQLQPQNINNKKPNSSIQTNNNPINPITPTVPSSQSKIVLDQSYQTKASYIPTSNSQKSGLHIVITSAPSIQNSRLTVDIDKLISSAYSINDTYILNGDIHIFLAISTSFIDGTVTIYKQTTSRLLQSGKTTLAVVKVNRFDTLSPNQLSSISAFSIIFQIFAWIGVILIIVSVLSGYGIIMQEYVINLQLIFLHVYIAADYLPLTFRDVIGGLNIIQNLNYFIPVHGQSIQKSWLGNVLQNGPLRFIVFNADINFTRQFYPIIIINTLYLLWFISLIVTKRWILRKDLIDQQKPFFYRMIDNIVNRPINYIDQIWRYQFLATIWICFIQFYNLTYPQGSNRSQVMNSILCIVSFICTLGWPVFISFYCHKYYYQNQYSDFLYKFQDIYYRKIPGYFLPSNHHRVGYPIVRCVKLLLAALVVAYLGSIASLTLVMLILIQIVEVGYAKFHQIYSDTKYFGHKVIQNAVFALIQFILFFLCNFSSLALTESYIYIGFILSGMCLIIILNGLARVGDLATHKYKQIFDELQWQLNEKQPKTERVV